MKKKVIALLLSAVVVVGAALGGTLAYLTDGEGSVNVATVGNVDIEQHELQRAENVEHKGTLADGDLVEFKQGQPLYPAYPAKDGAYTAEPSDLLYWGNYVTADGAGNGLWDDEKLVGVMDKFVFVENTGKSEAYYRTWIALECPEGMEFSEGSEKEFMMNINSHNLFNWEEKGYVEIDNQRYLIMLATYTEKLLPGEISRPSLLQVVMTHNATSDDAKLIGDTYEILAFTQAVQTKNMPDAAEALKAAFGDDHPWVKVADGEISDYVESFNFVSNAEELVAAIANGESVTLAEDIVLDDEQNLFIAKDANVTIDLNGNKLSQTVKCESSYSMIRNEGKLTINDGFGGGKISFEDTGAGDSTFGWGSYTISNNGGVLVINGGTVEYLGEQEFATHCSLAIFQYDGSTTINGGTISNPSYRSIRLWHGDMTLNGGVFDGQVWVHCVDDSAELTVNGGSFSPNGQDRSSLFVNNSGYTAKLSITGGTFATKIGSDSPIPNSVTGGTFGADPSAYVDTTKAYAKANGDGTWSVLPLYSYETVDGITYSTNAVNGDVVLVNASGFTGADLVIPEGVDGIGNKALNGKTTLKSVTFPASLTTLGYGAFNGCTSLESVTIKGNMTLNERLDGATNAHTFAGCTSLKTVIIEEGVTSLPTACFVSCTALKEVTIPASMKTMARRAFYDCLSLETVYLLSEDCEIGDSVFGSNQTGEFSEMTIFVVNDAMKNAVEATLDDNNKNSVKVIVMNTSADDLAAAVAAANGTIDNPTVIAVGAGNFTLPGATNKNITFVGTGLGTVIDYSHMGGYQEVSGSSLNFKNMTLLVGNTWEKGLQHTTKVTYEDCHIIGWQSVYADEVTFTNCTLDSNGGEHTVWSYGADKVTFTNCEFTYKDRAVNLFGYETDNDVITFTNCKFNFVEGTNACTGAIEMNSNQLESLKVIIDNCTVNNGDLWWISQWDSNKGANTTVIVDGKEIVTTIEALQAKLNAATVDTTLTLGADLAGNVTVTQKYGVDIVIDGNDHEFDGVIQINGCSHGENPETLTIKNINFVASSAIEASIDAYWGTDETRYAHNVTVDNCTFTMTEAAKHVTVAVDLYQPYNFTIKNCEVIGAQSVLQNKGGHDGITVYNVIANDCKNGIGLGTMDGAISISKCNMDVIGYGIRIDASVTSEGVAISDCNIEAYIPVVVRKATGTCNITLSGTNTMTQTNTEGLWCAVGTEEYGDVDKAGLTAANGTITVTLNDTGLDSNGIYVAE